MMSSTAGGGASGTVGAPPQVTVPPGFRFHPTDEELLYYYLRKKVAYEVIDLDVIRDVDLNKLEPWDLKEKCRIGSGPQNEWYFFSHKDKKYPTGTRTNRATNAGFWKATGRDKPIHLITPTTVNSNNNNNNNNNTRIGMRKTLVFYTGRAPHGQKTDWIMHEYRLDDDHHNQNSSDHQLPLIHQQEDGWVVCRVFKKKNHPRGFQLQQADDELHDHHHQVAEHEAATEYYSHHQQQQQQARSDHHEQSSQVKHSIFQLQQQLQYNHHQQQQHHFAFDGSMHLPQLLSPEQSAAVTAASFLQPIDIECSQNLMKLTSASSSELGGSGNGLNIHLEQAATVLDQNNISKYNSNAGGGGGDWSFLDKLLASQTNHTLDQLCQTSSVHKFPFHYLGCEADVSKLSNK